MIDVTVVLSARDIVCVPKLRELLAMQVNLSRQEPGCVRFEAFESQTVPGTFILIERWESQAALDTHRTAKGFHDNLCAAGAATGGPSGSCVYGAARDVTARNISPLSLYAGQPSRQIQNKSTDIRWKFAIRAGSGWTVLSNGLNLL